jgi:hypothetical protein
MFSPIHVFQQDVKLPFTFIFHFGGNLVENILGDKLKINKTIIASLIDKVFASSKEECKIHFFVTTIEVKKVGYGEGVVG